MDAPINGQAQNTPSNTQDGQVNNTSSNPQPSKIEVAGKSFTNQEELAKAYANLDSEFHKRDSEVSEWRKFGENIAPVWGAITKNPKLYAEVQKELGQDSNPSNGDTSGETGDEGKEDKKLVSNQPSDEATYLRNQVLSDFEEKNGFSQMSDTEKTEMRQNLAKVMAENHLLRQGETLKDIPLTMVPNLLHSAWKIHQVTKLTESGKLEGFAKAVANNYGSFGSMPASEEQAKGTITLTDAERKVAQKMKMPEADFLAYKEKIAKGSYTVTQRKA